MADPPGSGSGAGACAGAEPRWWTVVVPCLLTLPVSAWGGCTPEPRHIREPRESTARLARRQRTPHSGEHQPLLKQRRAEHPAAPSIRSGLRWCPECQFRAGPMILRRVGQPRQIRAACACYDLVTRHEE